MNPLSKSILDAIEKVREENKVKDLNRQINGQEWLKRQAIAIGESVKLEKKLDVTDTELQLRDFYYSSLAKYRNKDKFNYDITNARAIMFWRKVDDYRKKAGVDAGTYIKAQFSWFHKHFGSPPELRNLLSNNAIQRAIEYNYCKGNVVNSVVDYKSEVTEVLRSTDEMIRRIMKTHKITKEEFYKQFVLTKEFTVSKEYLKRDPIYLKLVGKNAKRT